MKKENIIKVVLCSLVAILAIGVIIFRGFSSNKIQDEVLRELNEKIVNISKYVNKYNIPLKGTSEVSANYKGAHGESFPKNYNFNYALEDNILYFSNKDGYNKLEFNKELVNLYNMFNKDIKDDILISKDEDNNGNSIDITLDIDHINDVLDTKFKSAKVTINKENIMSNKVKDITLTIDDYIITIDNNRYKIMYNDNKIDLNIVNKGYSLAINNTVKMNVIYEDNVDKYNIVVDNFVYSLNISDNSVKFTANTRASIYNSVEAIFTGSEVNIDKNKESDIKNNPLTRYFNEKE